MAFLRTVQRSILSLNVARIGLLNKRACLSSGNLLIEEPEFSWLKELDLKPENDGVFNGNWKGNGDVRNVGGGGRVRKWPGVGNLTLVF